MFRLFSLPVVPCCPSLATQHYSLATVPCRNGTWLPRIPCHSRSPAAPHHSLVFRPSQTSAVPRGTNRRNPLKMFTQTLRTRRSSSPAPPATLIAPDAPQTAKLVPPPPSTPSVAVHLTTLPKQPAISRRPSAGPPGGHRRNSSLPRPAAVNCGK
jgi:hypothetical protein